MILDTIIARTVKDLDSRKRAVSRDKLIATIAAQEPARDFRGALARPNAVNIIAEVKKASPSKGVIRPDFDPVAIARSYADNGAQAVSVLTEEHFFQGHIDYLSMIRREIDIAVLRKDFIVDPYQVYEARAAGADAFLLIAAVLNAEQLRALIRLGSSLGMHALVEVHTAAELEIAVNAESNIIGINNRNLNTFETDIETTLRLRPLIPSGIVTVSESGIATPEDIRRLRSCGIDAFLIGESLMRASDPGRMLCEFLSP